VTIVADSDQSNPKSAMPGEAGHCFD